MCLLNILCTFILRLVFKGSTFYLTKAQRDLEKVKHSFFRIALQLYIYFSEKILFLLEERLTSRNLWAFGTNLYIFGVIYVVFLLIIFLENPSRFQGARGNGDICRSSRSEMFYKTGVLKNSEKNTCVEVSFLTKLQT